MLSGPGGGKFISSPGGGKDASAGGGNDASAGGGKDASAAGAGAANCGTGAGAATGAAAACGGATCGGAACGSVGGGKFAVLLAASAGAAKEPSGTGALKTDGISGAGVRPGVGGSAGIADSAAGHPPTGAMVGGALVNGASGDAGYVGACPDADGGGAVVRLRGRASRAGGGKPAGWPSSPEIGIS
jgi:hypothetical protein